VLIEERPNGDETIVVIRKDRLDAAVAQEFKSALCSMIDSGRRRLTVDFTEVGFVDSSGLGAMVGVLKHLGREGSLELTGLNAAVRKVFDLTRLSDVFVIHDRVAGP